MRLNAKFIDPQAVIGIGQMKKLDWRVKRKKEMYRLYGDLLVDIEEIEFIDTNLKDTSPWFIDILVKKGISCHHFWIKGNFKNAEYVSRRWL